jgi:hypothetical protein
MGMTGDADRLAEADAAAEARVEVLDVLRDLLVWQLAPPRWPEMGRIVESIATALAGGNLDALRAATADLELASPVRITRIGATPVVPAPPPLRERVNHLVHSLEATARQAAACHAIRATAPGGDDDRPPAR